MNKIKTSIILALLALTILCLFIDISYGIYFAVLTNTFINIFYTANICWRNYKKKSNNPFGFSSERELLNEDERRGPPRL